MKKLLRWLRGSLRFMDLLGERAFGCGRWASALRATTPNPIGCQLPRSGPALRFLVPTSAASLALPSELYRCSVPQPALQAITIAPLRESTQPQNSKLETQNSKLLNERGVALVLVLWIFIFLFVVAFDFSASVREEGMAVHRHAGETEGYYLALAGFEQALYEMLQQPAASGRAAVLQWKDIACKDGDERSLGDGFFRVRPIDEGGKINLNRADETTLRRIFTSLRVEEPQTSILVDSILDWRDNDDLHRLNGAERDYYSSLSPSYTPKNGPFDTVEELLWVRGMTPELFYGLQADGQRGAGLTEIFTVDSPMDRVNLGTASAEVIHALLGISLKDSRKFVEDRCKQLGEGTLADMLKLLGIAAGDAALRQFVFTNPSVITIEAAGRPAESATQRQVKGVVRVVGGQRGFDLIRWVDRDMVRTEQ